MYVRLGWHSGFKATGESLKVVAKDLDPAQLDELRQLYALRHKELREAQAAEEHASGKDGVAVAAAASATPPATRKAEKPPPVATTASAAGSAAPHVGTAPRATATTCPRVVVCTVTSVEVYDNAAANGGKNGRRSVSVGKDDNPVVRASIIFAGADSAAVVCLAKVRVT
jgi:hypothetical protein